MGLSGFDKAYYLNAKLLQLKAGGSGWEDRTAEDLDTILRAVYGLEAQDHYTTYGYLEGLNPNYFFDRKEYAYAKAADMVKKGLAANTTEALATLSSAWPGDLYQHYIQYGSAEGINPSNRFDESLYLETKLAALKTDPQSAIEWGSKSVDDLRAFLSEIGLTVVAHYLTYGQSEGMTVSQVPADEQVTLPGTDPGPTTPDDQNAYTLTVGMDQIVGNDEDNVFNAPVTNGLQTLNSGDDLDGGQGMDMLFAQLNNIPVVVPSLDSIETLRLNSTLANGAILDAANTQGVTRIENIQSTAAVSVIHLAELPGSGILISNAMADMTLGFLDTALDSGADRITVYLDGYSGNTTFTAGSESDPNGDIELLTIHATGGASDFGTGGVDMADVTSVTVKASAAIDLGDAYSFESLATFDASQSTAGVTARFAGKSLPDTNVLLRGGAGDDRFDATAFNDYVILTADLGDGDDTIAFYKDNYKSNWQIDGGSGTNTLEFDQGVAPSGSYTNFQAIRFTGDKDVTQDMSDLLDTITLVRIDVAQGNAVTLSGLEENDTVTLEGDQTTDDGAAVTLKGDAGVNTVNVILDDDTGQGIDLDDPDGGLVIDGNIQKIILIPTADEIHSLDLNASLSLSEVVIKGAGEIDLRGKADDVPLNDVTTRVDASEATGKVYVLAGGQDTTLLGGEGNDTLTGAAGGDTILGNNGNDTLESGGGTNTLTGGKGADTITCNGTDTVVYTDAGDGTFIQVLSSTITDADDLLESRADDVNAFTSGTDKIKVDDALQTAVNSLGINDDVVKELTGVSNTFDYDAATVFIISADVGTADIGDISALSTLFNDTLETDKVNAAAGQEILFTAEDADKETGIYYFKDADGNAEISQGDHLALLGVVDTQLAAGDFVFG